ncbi:MAG: tetratricopeptide repeat protein [Candidatus Roizmanbacteria bacterium]|nr:tetratricopeptide repeat protein [Candidatus Roizmanbacteria bacterium]
MEEIDTLETKAIDAAIQANWTQAIEFNSQILELDRKNVQALLRIAFSYLQTGNYEESKKYYHKALRLQPKSSVAHQYLEKLEILEQGKTKPQTKTAFDPHLFIESFGKTKMTSLTNLGQKQILAQLSIGQRMQLKIKKRRVEIRTESDEYVGTLADDISKRLILFIKAKSTYTAYIKEVSFTKVIIFIREDKKGRSVNHHISFPINLQKNIEQIGDTNQAPTAEHPEEPAAEEEDDNSLNDWEKMVAEQTEEKEEQLLDIQPEDLDDEDEE